LQCRTSLRKLGEDELARSKDILKGLAQSGSSSLDAGTAATDPDLLEAFNPDANQGSGNGAVYLCCGTGSQLPCLPLGQSTILCRHIHKVPSFLLLSTHGVVPRPPPGGAPDLSDAPAGSGKKKWREMLSRPDADYEGLFGTQVTEKFGMVVALKSSAVAARRTMRLIFASPRHVHRPFSLAH
jgi:hypothetical protein